MSQLATPNLIDIILLSFGTWRVSQALVIETGPFNLFRVVRELLGFEYAEDGLVIVLPESFPGTVFTCVWCMSFWIAFPALTIFYVSPIVVTFLGLWGLASAIASLILSLSDDE